jgi:hypothetical protein
MGSESRKWEVGLGREVRWKGKKGGKRNGKYCRRWKCKRCKVKVGSGMASGSMRGKWEVDVGKRNTEGELEVEMGRKL